MHCSLHVLFNFLGCVFRLCSYTFFLDKANRLDVGNAVNPRPSEEDKKLVVVKSPNAVNPLVWDYFVSKTDYVFLFIYV